MQGISVTMQLLFSIYLLTGCSGKSNDQNSRHSASFPYNLQTPDSKFFLPYEIEEISGLSYFKENQLASIQDERGAVYIFDLNQEKIVNELKFGRNGDYEGIEIVGDTVYAVRSDGQIYQTTLTATDESATQIFNTPLSHKNDVEGLGYDAANKRLLLACKGIAGIAGDQPGSRAVYAFDLTTNSLTAEPVFLIRKDEVNAQLSQQYQEDTYRPSGIAVHPVTGQIYLVASVGKVLIVLDKNGSIESVYPLASADFRQPEGICFAPNGDMFISNEGKGGKATILRFNYTKHE